MLKILKRHVLKGVSKLLRHASYIFIEVHREVMDAASETLHIDGFKLADFSIQGAGRMVHFNQFYVKK